MGRVEEVTLPARFMLTAAHLIATLTIVYDVSETTKRAMGHDLTGYSSERRTLEALAWTSVACFIVEILGMFSGVSLFMPSANVCYIFCHFFGAIFVTLFCVLEWDLDVFPWLFALFSFVPAIAEMLIAFLVLQMNIMQYK
mmetsp:Transcript_1543/g.3500  ORF Transcript_1543/g.3500 Transcript_1543/m.3500 type:complete len:141 (-) Transcript_1543:554-976(-)